MQKCENLISRRAFGYHFMVYLQAFWVSRSVTHTVWLYVLFVPCVPVISFHANKQNCIPCSLARAYISTTFTYLWSCYWVFSLFLTFTFINNTSKGCLHSIIPLLCVWNYLLFKYPSILIAYVTCSQVTILSNCAILSVCQQSRHSIFLGTRSVLLCMGLGSLTYG